MDEELKQYLTAMESRIIYIVTDVKESLEREVHGVKTSMDKHFSWIVRQPFSKPAADGRSINKTSGLPSCNSGSTSWTEKSLSVTVRPNANQHATIAASQSAEQD